MARRRDAAIADLLDAAPAEPGMEALADGACVLRGFARAVAPALLDAVAAIAAVAPFRHMETPGGWRMSVAMTNAGRAGWLTDRSGYRYDARDPETGLPWPPLPAPLADLAGGAAAAAGFAGFVPDAALINRYAPGSRLSLHQDRNERDPAHPIVSVSLGLPATFLWAVPRAPSGRAGSGCAMATWWYGAARPGSPSTASTSWPTASIRRPAPAGST